MPQSCATEIAEIEDGEPLAIGGIAALRLRRCRQRKREGEDRKRQVAVHPPLVGDAKPAGKSLSVGAQPRAGLRPRATICSRNHRKPTASGSQPSHRAA